MLARRAFLAIAVVGVLAACGGARASLPVAIAAPAAGAGAKTTLTISLALSKPAGTATKLQLYAYVLTDRGPLPKPPSSTLVLTADVAAGATGCNTAAGIRTCVLGALVPNANDGVVAILSNKTGTAGVAFATVDVPAAPSLALIAGRVPIARLNVSAPFALVRDRFGVGVTPFDANGNVVLVDTARVPLSASIYGPAGVMPSPSAAVSGSGAVATFAWSGKTFVNAMTVAGFAGSMTNTAQIFPRKTSPLACAPLSNTTTYAVPEPTIYTRGFALHASIAGSKVQYVALDTGSTSFLIAKTKLTGANAKLLIGPGQSAQQKYEPSGLILKGYYYLAPVTLYDRGGKNELGTTVPMEVMVTDEVCAPKKPCARDTTTAYMGVGFGRPSPNPSSQPGLMAGPLENAFMQLSSIVQGTMHPGFSMTPNQLTIGVNTASSTGFPTVQLSPYPNRPGDWSGPPACLRFNGGAAQCGRMLLDIGINTMFVNAATPSPLKQIEIDAPNAKKPLLTYSFAYPVSPGATPPAPNPRASVPVVFGSSKSVFVNTGRDVLAAADYLYDAGCGLAGFKTPAP